MNEFKKSDLDLCPHSNLAFQHRWHGLPLEGCGGSHLNANDAKTLAKPISSEKKNLESLKLQYSMWRNLFG
jgi:hypothetical protein